MSTMHQEDIPHMKGNLVSRKLLEKNHNTSSFTSISNNAH